MLVRLHKYLADQGVASRRKCEEYIRHGLVKLNGKIVKEMGIKVDPDKDNVEIAAGLKLRKQDFVYFAFHKPAGYVTTVAGAERPKITELLTDISERIFPIGRLDKLTSGLLLLTNDGRLAYSLTHPKFEKEKEYVVKVRQKVTPAILNELQKAIFIRGMRTKPAEIIVQGPHIFKVILKEGRNRQIRRLCQKAGLQIEKLKRIRIDEIFLGDLKVGEYRPLTKKEIGKYII